ncbi:unnamed protein product, partial [Lota lota]
TEQHRVEAQTTSPTPTTTDPPPKPQPYTDQFLGPEHCLEKQYSRNSCDRMFCLPWQRCVEGKCACKPPYMCPKKDRAPICGHDGRKYLSYCQVMSASCLYKRVLMSHFLDVSETCSARVPKFSSTLDREVVQVFLPTQKERLFVCPSKWGMTAANVLCRNHKYPLGAASASAVALADQQSVLSRRCVEVQCQGYENSLAECHLRPSQENSSMVATARCYTKVAVERCASSEFHCVNGKCVSLNVTCNGVDDCGDGSDEMCCKDCRLGFFCKPGVCVSHDVVHDKIRDCLDGKDEAPLTPKALLQDRAFLESQLKCGIPNSSSVNDEVRQRVKRVVGGTPAKP